MRAFRRATECAGHIADAVGRSSFEPYIGPCIALASSGYALEHLELQENTFAFFSCIVEVLSGGSSADLAALLPQLVPLTLTVVCGDEGLEVIRDGGDDIGENLADRLHAIRADNNGGVY